jgi:predicted ATPase with chaperone activity
MSVDACLIEVGVKCRRSNAMMMILGLPDAAVKESRDRVEPTLGNSGFMNRFSLDGFQIEKGIAEASA